MPAYSTDKGFTGAGGGTTGGTGGPNKKDKKDAFGNYDTGPGGVDNFSGTANIGGSKPGTTPVSSGGTGGKPSKKSKLPPGLNPAKYTENTTPSYEATLSNIGTLVGQAVAGLALPGAGIGLGPLAGEITGLGPEFENPTGPQVKGDYDSASQVNQSSGNVVSQMGADEVLKKASVVQAKKKKVEEKPGFSLLAGAGGTLLGT